MVVFDATLLIAFLHPDGPPPRCPRTNDPVDAFKERIDCLINRLEESQDKIIIPTPALSEILVRAGEAAPKYLERISSVAMFRPAPFDELAAVEVAAMTRGAIDATGNRRGDQDGTWAKIKYDRQIVAIAKVNKASAIYSDDSEIHKLGQKQGLKVIRTADLSLPPIDPQMQLDLSPSEKATQLRTRVVRNAASILERAGDARLAHADIRTGPLTPLYTRRAHQITPR